jgi:hypothetical protein
MYMDFIWTSIYIELLEFLMKISESICSYAGSLIFFCDGYKAIGIYNGVEDNSIFVLKHLYS